MSALYYKLTVVRVEPHPKAGEEVPREHYDGWGNRPKFPPTQDIEALSVDLNPEEFAAVKKACIEACK